MKIRRYEKKKLLAMILISMLVLANLAGCTPKETAKQEGKSVKTVKVTNSFINLNVEYAGDVKPFDEVSIASKIPGTVQSVNFDVGNEVKAGDILFTIDPKTYRAQQAQSKAAVDSASANLDRVRDSGSSQQTLQYEAAESQAKIMYDDAKKNYEDAKALFEADAISQQQLDNAQSAYENAEIQWNTAKENLRLLKEKATPQNNAIASAQLEQAQAAYNLASIQVNDTTVAAPISGMVSIRNVSKGELVSGAIPAFTLIDIKMIYVEISIPDTLVSKVHKDQKIPVKIDVLGDKTFEGIVDTISPATDNRTQFYKVRLKVENPDFVIKPGMFARVILPLENRSNVLTVPNEAIVVEDGIQTVFAVSDGKVKKVTLTIGLSNDKQTEVVSGLNAGDIVITEGQSFLNEGEPVIIKQ